MRSSEAVKWCCREVAKRGSSKAVNWQSSAFAFVRDCLMRFVLACAVVEESGICAYDT